MKIVSFVEANHACTYYREILPAEYMKKDGIINIIMQPEGGIPPTNHTLFKKAIQFADVVRFARFVDWLAYIKYANKQNKLTIYSTDDYFEFGKENPFGEVARREQYNIRCVKMAKKCDGIIVSTQALKKEYFKYNDNVHVIPNMLDLGQRQWNCKKRKSDGKIIIGYYGSPTHYHDLIIPAKAITRLMWEFPNLEFHYGILPQWGIIYDPKSQTKKYRSELNENNPTALAYRSLSANMPPKRVKLLKWRDIKNYGEVYANFDIGIAPLNNTTMNQYKSNLKLLEAGAYGLPVVCSPICPFLETVEHGVDALFATTEDEWYVELKRLIQNEKLRQRLGRALNENIRIHYDIRKQYRRWLDCIYAIGLDSGKLPLPDLPRYKDSIRQRIGKLIYDN